MNDPIAQARAALLSGDPKDWPPELASTLGADRLSVATLVEAVVALRGGWTAHLEDTAPTRPDGTDGLFAEICAAIPYVSLNSVTSSEAAAMAADTVGLDALKRSLADGMGEAPTWATLASVWRSLVGSGWQGEATSSKGTWTGFGLMDPGRIHQEGSWNADRSLKMKFGIPTDGVSFFGCDPAMEVERINAHEFSHFVHNFLDPIQTQWLYPGHRRECVADCAAAILMFRRGAEEALRHIAGMIAVRSAQLLLCGDLLHWTSPALRALAREGVARGEEFAAMSIEDAVKLAKSRIDAGIATNGREGWGTHGKEMVDVMLPANQALLDGAEVSCEEDLVRTLLADFAIGQALADATRLAPDHFVKDRRPAHGPMAFGAQAGGAISEVEEALFLLFGDGPGEGGVPPPDRLHANAAPILKGLAQRMAEVSTAAGDTIAPQAEARRACAEAASLFASAAGDPSSEVGRLGALIRLACETEGLPFSDWAGRVSVRIGLGLLHYRSLSKAASAPGVDGDGGCPKPQGTAPTAVSLREAACDVLAAMDGLREKMGIRPMADFKPNYPFDVLLAARMHVLTAEETAAVDDALARRLKGLENDLPDGWKAGPAEDRPGGTRP